MNSINGPRFPMGRTAITPAAEAALHAAGIHPIRLLARHIHGDWGELPAEDLAANELALLSGKRLLSSYAIPGGGKVWLITEADRALTTILLPEDY
ncbi:hypothetical protein [Paraburkholderia terricola]|jgi:hypothetical protein|uniref:hypothetical protein n=1 Tax=Paraburkholderia terricola TaxID=169427 RepID=UPI000DEEC5E5|nr:hypothetical protein [Paraburkholderia terricola]AXE91060.1 hypothetical protein CUJ90_00845 [Paraburkholderia terricola]